jgi:ornithine cyclodeaminase/alanine dehydrogenase
MDCTWITAKRTGAATAVAAKYLVNKESITLGILGCGVQGRSNLEALWTILKSLQNIKAYDINDENLRLYVKEMTAEYGVEIVPVRSPKEAVENCDIIVTAGPILKNPTPTIEASWLKEGVFTCPLDFDSYWKPEAIHAMNKFCTDDQNQLAYYMTQGYFSDIPEVYADLGEICTGRRPGRETQEERIMSMNLGLAIEDMATATIVYKKAIKTDTGTRLPL